jgi:predicted metal-binding protein
MKSGPGKIHRKSQSQRGRTGKALAEIGQALLAGGACAIKLIDVDDIVIDERVRLKCQIPRCDSFGKNLMCPPHVPSVASFREALSRFSRALLIQVSAPLDQNPADRPSAGVFAAAGKLHDLVNLAEKRAFEKGFRFATGLIGGCCRLCETCVAVEAGQACRFPFKARPSMEAMGIDVVATAEKASLPMGFPIAECVTWTGVVLI